MARVTLILSARVRLDSDVPVVCSCVPHGRLFLNAHRLKVLPGAAELIFEEFIPRALDLQRKVFWDEKAAGSDERRGVRRKTKSQYGR